MSDTHEQATREPVKAEQERRWLEENRAAIASINAFIERHGLCADRLRYRPQETNSTSS
jgi:post-segregation antitoxin (ccd killing protein)